MLVINKEPASFAVDSVNRNCEIVTLNTRPRSSAGRYGCLRSLCAFKGEMSGPQGGTEDVKNKRTFPLASSQAKGH